MEPSFQGRNSLMSLNFGDQPLVYSNGFFEPTFLEDNYKKFEEDTISFSNATAETKWDQYSLCNFVDGIMDSEEGLSEASVCPLNGTFDEKDDEFLFDFSGDLDDCIPSNKMKKNGENCSKRKSRFLKPQKKKRNVMLEAWCCIRKFFLKFLGCPSAISTIKQNFYANYSVWETNFEAYHRVFMKVAKKIPRKKVSVEFFENIKISDPRSDLIIKVLKRLFTEFLEQKADRCVIYLEQVSNTMKEVLFEMIILFKNKMHNTEQQQQSPDNNNFQH